MDGLKLKTPPTPCFVHLFYLALWNIRAIRSDILTVHYNFFPAFFHRQVKNIVKKRRASGGYKNSLKLLKVDSFSFFTSLNSFFYKNYLGNILLRYIEFSTSIAE